MVFSNRMALFACLAAVCGTVFWAAVPSVTAGRSYPSDVQSGRHLLGGLLDTLAAMHSDGGPIRVLQPPALVVPITVQPTTADASAGASAAAAAQPVATAVPTAALGVPLGAAPAAPATATAAADAVALAAAQALGAKSGGSAGGINIVSSAPMALSNPIDVEGGTYTGQFQGGLGLGH